MKKVIALLALTILGFTAQAQVTNTGSFFQSFQSYFTSFNTNLDTTFGASKGSIWTGVDSIQGGSAALANVLGVSYNFTPLLSVESVTRNSGIAGTIVGEQVGLGLNFTVHDARLTVYADGGYDFTAPVGSKVLDRIYGEIGLRVCKALTEHTFAGVGIGAQFPANRQVFSAFAGITF